MLPALILVVKLWPEILVYLCHHQRYRLIFIEYINTIFDLKANQSRHIRPLIKYLQQLKHSHINITNEGIKIGFYCHINLNIPTYFSKNIWSYLKIKANAKKNIIKTFFLVINFGRRMFWCIFTSQLQDFQRRNGNVFFSEKMK